MTPPSRYKSRSQKSKIRNTAKYYLFPEGTKTEINYFAESKLKQHFRITNIEVVKADDTSLSDPLNLAEYANAYLKKEKIKPDSDNIIVFVFDLEMGQHKRYDKCRELRNKFCDTPEFYRFYVSNPCIELWFVMHDENFNTLNEIEFNSAGNCKKLFGAAPFYGNYDNLYDRLDVAIKNAEELIRVNQIDISEPCTEDIVFTTIHILFNELGIVK
jgi:hypothetical protein